MPRIPLPNAKQDGERRAHPFPLQIGYQTLEFLHGAIFYSTITDFATDAYINQHHGKPDLESMMIALGLEKNAYVSGWEILDKYRDVFKSVPFQTTVISLCSHRDWYVRRLSEFIRIGREHLAEQNLQKDDERRLNRADRLPIKEQIEILSIASGVNFDVSDVEACALHEMSLVRNIGLHNRWEVDAKYLSETQTIGYAVGDLRILQSAEIGQWHKALIKLVQLSSVKVAIKYLNIPNDII